MPRSLTAPVRIAFMLLMPVIRRRGDIQLVAYRSDPVFAAQGIHQGRNFFQRRSNSAFTKYAEAWRRISLLRRSSRTSRSSSFRRWRSVVLSPPSPPPVSRSCWRKPGTKSLRRAAYLGGDGAESGPLRTIFVLAFQNQTNGPLTDFGGKAGIFSHPVYLSLRKFSLQDYRCGSELPDLSLSKKIRAVQTADVARSVRSPKSTITTMTNPAMMATLNPARAPKTSMTMPASTLPSATPMLMPVVIQMRPSVSLDGGTMIVPRFITMTIVGANDIPATKSITERI